MIAFLILPMFLFIMSTLVLFYKFMWYVLIAINSLLLIYTAIYLRMVFKQKETIELELKKPSESGNHYIVIPIYNEDFGVLRSTIQVLSEHEFAQDYTIVFALESRDIKKNEYMKNLNSFFGNMVHEHGTVTEFASLIFKRALVTYHPEELIKGKHMNLNYCLRQVYKFCKTDNALVTVTDADAHIPNLYINYVSRLFKQARSKYIMFAPSTLFAQNPSCVPTLVRVKDASWAIGHMTSLSHSKKIMPLSSYSLPLELIHEIEYWDCTEYGFGEDSAMMYRAVQYTEKHEISFDLQAVLIPFNYLNVNTGSYWETIKERYKQSLRHNLAYLMLELSIYKALEIKTFRMYGLVGSYFECVIMTLLLGWIWLVAGICWYESFQNRPNINSGLLEYIFEQNVAFYWSVVLLKFHSVCILLILPCIALVYDLNHYFVGKFKLYGLAKYSPHSMLAHFDIWFFPLSSVTLIMTAGIHSAYNIFKQQMNKFNGYEYDFMVDSSKKL
eukprot:NODE_23_length_42016_cov_0.755803.p7 type:complete len:500 gc:universal NODE_23_length_42016_cov_0.755803:25507-27006(+)